jgi:hypothetical protein
MPRLSVDIDLAYLPIADRPTSIAAIEDALKRIAADLEKGLGAKVAQVRTGKAQELTRLSVDLDGANIKIEVTPVFRGVVFGASVQKVTAKIEEAFGFAEIQVVSFADLYGGKIVAALDRQHPRDLFDVRDLMRNEGVDDALRQAFAVYLISSRRPMAELLTIRPKDIKTDFERGFDGMTDEAVTLDDLLEARTAIHKVIAGKMPDAHRRLILSVENGEPDWTLLGVEGVADLPSVNWRLQNIKGLEEKRRAANVEELKRVLNALV